MRRWCGKQSRLSLESLARRTNEAHSRFPARAQKAEEGGFWAEAPSIPGCATQGGTMEEIESNVREAIEGRLSLNFEVQIVGGLSRKGAKTPRFFRVFFAAPRLGVKSGHLT